jgi:hypothetical protein
MKIVINTCYGGFGLSNEAMFLYLKKTGIDCFFYKQTTYSGQNENRKQVYTRLSNVDAFEDENSLIYIYSKDLGETVNKFMSEYYCDRSFENDRQNKFLIETIEELGSDKSSGSCANLKIIDIPDDVRYEITNYDGIESIHETHRSW